MSLIQPALPNPASPVELGADLGKGVAVGAAATAVTEVAPEAQGNSRSDPVPGGGAPRRAAVDADGGSAWLTAASLATALVDRCRCRWWLAALGLAVQDVDDACGYTTCRLEASTQVAAVVVHGAGAGTTSPCVNPDLKHFGEYF